MNCSDSDSGSGTFHAMCGIASGFWVQIPYALLLGLPLSWNLSHFKPCWDTLWVQTSHVVFATTTASWAQTLYTLLLGHPLSSNPLHSFTWTPSWVQTLYTLLLGHPLIWNHSRCVCYCDSLSSWTHYALLLGLPPSSTLSRCIVLTGTTSEFRSHWDHLRVQRFYAAWYPTETSSEFRPFTLSYWDIL